MPDPQNRGIKFVYFILGIALPLAGYLIWSSGSGCFQGRKSRGERARDKTVEDSFPASDPPSTW